MIKLLGTSFSACNEEITGQQTREKKRRHWVTLISLLNGHTVYKEIEIGLYFLYNCDTEETTITSNTEDTALNQTMNDIINNEYSDLK